MKTNCAVPTNSGFGRASIRAAIAVLACATIASALPLTTEVQGYLNLKSYWEFANQNRPDGWNAWVTFVISPAEQTPSAPPRRMIAK